MIGERAVRALWALRTLIRDRRQFADLVGDRAVYVHCPRCGRRADGQLGRPRLGVGLTADGVLAMLDVPGRQARGHGQDVQMVTANGITVYGAQVVLACPHHAPGDRAVVTPAALVALAVRHAETSPTAPMHLSITALRGAAGR